MKPQSVVFALSIRLAAALLCVGLTAPSQALAAGASQISGIAFPAGPGQWSDPEGQGSDFAVTLISL
jgi:hypothetical protein